MGCTWPSTFPLCASPWQWEIVVWPSDLTRSCGSWVPGRQPATNGLQLGARTRQVARGRRRRRGPIDVPRGRCSGSIDSWGDAAGSGAGTQARQPRRRKTYTRSLASMPAHGGRIGSPSAVAVRRASADAGILRQQGHLSAQYGIGRRPSRVSPTSPRYGCRRRMCRFTRLAPG